MKNMAFHTANYETYVLLGDERMPPLWNWASWRRLHATLDPLMQAARGKPGLSVLQVKDRKSVKFGRIGWSIADQQKWTHGSPITKQKSKSWSFTHADVWAPTRGICGKENRSPDVFLSMLNESLGPEINRDTRFNPSIVFAVTEELARKQASLIANILLQFQSIISPRLIGHRLRPWGTSFGKDAFTNSIQDLCFYLFPWGPKRHLGEVSFELLVDKWEPVILPTTVITRS